MTPAELRAKAATAAPQAAPNRAPEARGEPLGTIPKRDGEELRIAWDEYEGHPYLSLRLWRRDHHGTWWPVKGEGCSVGRRYLGTLAEAVAAAMERSEAMAASPPRDERAAQ